MPTSVGPNTFGEENLVFGYDTGDTVNSYRGEPTINRAYLHNARIDSSYAALDLSGYQGALESLHPGALTVYNQSGGNISTYFNTGINIGNSGVDWYNTNHAYWVYDEILKKPVTQIIDRTGVWQAKYMGLGVTWDDLGMVPGDQYTLSWLQWNSDGVKRPNVGVYWNSGGSNNFWDGTRDAGASPAGVWTRKSYTWTLGNYDTDTSLTLYMYGHYHSRATLRIADVQVEKKGHASQFSFGYERSATQGLIDLKGTSTIDLTNVSFDSNAQMAFDGTTDYVTVPHNTAHSFTGDFSIEIVFRPTGNTANCLIQKGSGNDYFQEYWVICDTRSSNRQFELIMGQAGNTSANYNVRASNSVTIGQYHHIVTGVQGSTGFMYVNGELIDTGAVTDRIQSTSDIRIGERVDGFADSLGDQPLTKVYNRALTASEIRSNFNAIKGRFGI